MNALKVGLVGFWIFCLGCFFVGVGSTLASLGRTAFWLMAAAHVIECAVFLPSLRKADGPLAGHLVQTFVFGFFHVREVRGRSA